MAEFEDSYDVVVVGAGMGGLAHAALLAKAKMKVCVVDMASRPGGYLMGFERKGFTFDTSTHWLNECSPGGSVRTVLDLLGPGAPEMPRLKRIRRYKGGTFDYTLTDDPDELRDQLIRDFPDDEAGLYEFFALAKRMGDLWQFFSKRQRSHLTMGMFERFLFTMSAIRGLPIIRYSSMKTDDMLPRFFKEGGAGRVFCSEENILSCLVPIGWAYHGDYQRPPDGGAKRVPEWICSVLSEWGTTVHLNHRVDQIVVEDGRAVGVRVSRNRSSSSHLLRSKYVVAACDIVSLYENALPEAAAAACKAQLEKIAKADMYESIFAVNLGLNVDVRDLGLGEDMIFLTADGLARREHNSSDPHKAGMYVIAPSARDPSLAPPGKGTLSIQVMAAMEYGDYWKTDPGLRRGKAYDEFKEQYADVLFDRIEAALVPNLRKHIECCDIATPVTHWRYTGNFRGSIMGSRPTRQNFRAGVAAYQSPIKNLLVGGHWAENGGGVPVAVRAGVNSALLILMKERPAAFRRFSRVIDGKLPPEECVGPDLLTTAAARALGDGTMQLVTVDAAAQ